MKKSLEGKLTLNRETLRGLSELRRSALVRAEGGATANTCYRTCICPTFLC